MFFFLSLHFSGLLFLPSATLFIPFRHSFIFFYLLKRRRCPGPIRILEQRSSRGSNPTPSARGGTRSGATTRCFPFFTGAFRPGVCSTDESPGHPPPTRPRPCAQHSRQSRARTQRSRRDWSPLAPPLLETAAPLAESSRGRGSGAGLGEPAPPTTPPPQLCSPQLKLSAWWSGADSQVGSFSGDPRKGVVGVPSP